ncbi:Multidrug resistance protein stp [Pseudovibrio axinellae]|uniref:Multidrug resistance protein stp n=1 Tax=Pseudovibrio axinellae TaxID=989403 RepID=A0A165VSG2_9HYPH|nr:MFS transporter [Pseudovibrio axinellae]KZL15375.1 Multidrug resistance protein stp [Pseudovibrio axinellae]SER53825.1 drug resistance transporter, EmrB/QacA subfamily [Pseudovibrio axinellae]
MTRKYLILLNMIGIVALVMIDQSVMGIILPPLQRTYEFDPIHMQWAINAYLVALAAMLMCGGWLGDQLGYFASLRIGVALFAVASLFCAYAPSGDIFIISRVFQGAGAALMQPAATAIIFSAFPKEERGKALAHYGSAGLLFLATAPLIGGALVQYSSWRAIFLINIPIAITVLVLSYFVGERVTKKESVSFDLKGAALFIVALVVFTVSIQFFGDDRLHPIDALVSAGVLLVICWMLYARRHKVAHPFIQFSLFKNKTYLGCCILLFCIPFALLAQLIFGSIFLLNVIELTPIQTGLSILPIVVTITIFAQIGGRLVGKVAFRNLAFGGSMAMATGFVLQALVVKYHNLWMLFPGMIVMGVGLGFLFSTVSTEALTHISLFARARATALLQTFRQVGGLFGVVCIGSLINWREKTMISEAAAHLKIDDKEREWLQIMLFRSASDQPIAIAVLHERWPEGLLALKSISSSALSSGYYLAAFVLLSAALVSLWMFKVHTKAETNDASDPSTEETEPP